MSSYQSIVVTNAEEAPLLGGSANSTKGRFAVIAAFLLIAGVAVAVMKGAGSNSMRPIMGKGSPVSPPCSFAVCEKSGCPKDISPFACTGWEDPNLETIGCSPMPWIVGADGSTCIESCDLSGCKDAVPDKSDVSCEGVLCKNCDDVKCGSGAPYQCLEGSSRYACSSDEYYYNLLLKTQCSGCCDTREC